jgi:FkbM family methyltransferase
LFAALVGPSGRVIAFEPAPSPFRSLQRNVAINELASVRALQAAAFDSNSTTYLSYATDHPTQGKLREVEPSYSVPGAFNLEVRGMRLDEMLKQERWPGFIKIDVEGGAGPVLRGAIQILEEVQPHIYIELHGPDERAAVRDELLSRGYVAETMDGRGVSDPTGGAHASLWCYKGVRPRGA